MERPTTCRFSAGAFVNARRGDACVARIVASIHEGLPGDACVASASVPCATAGWLATVDSSDRPGMHGAPSWRGLPGTLYPSQPRTFTQETAFGVRSGIGSTNSLRAAGMRHARTSVIESRLADPSVGDSVRGEVVRIGGVEIVAGEQFKHESPESGLERRAGYGRMRAVHTAIAGLGLQNRSAAAASVERPAELRGHRLHLGSAALGAGERRLEDQQVFERCHSEAANQPGVPSRWKPAPPPGNPSGKEQPANPADVAWMTSAADTIARISSPSSSPAPKWSRAIANVTRNERVPTCSPTGAAKPQPIQALVFSG